MKELEELKLFLLSEMANLRSERTGLPMTVWVSAGEAEGKRLPHGPRMKVAMSHGVKIKREQMATVTVSDSPRLVGGHLSSEDLQQVKRFILLNKKVLIRYWNSEIDDEDLRASIKLI